MKSSELSVPIAIGLIVFSLFLASILILYLLPQGIPFPFVSFIPLFLFQSFHYAAFFVPFYFFSCGLILLRRPFRLETLILLNYMILPFFTLGLVLRLFFDLQIYDSPVTAFFASSFTPTGGAILASLILGLELALAPGIFTRVSRHYQEKRRQSLRTIFPKSRRGSLMPQDVQPRRQMENIDPSQDTFSSPPLAQEDDYSDLGDDISPQGADLPDEKREESLDLVEELGEHISPVPTFPEPEIAREDAQELERLAVSFQEANKEEEISEDSEALEDGGELEALEELDDFEELEELEELDESFEEEPEDFDEDEEGSSSREAAPAEEKKSPPQPVPGASPGVSPKGYSVPVEGLLSSYSDSRYWEIDEETRQAGDVLRSTLEEFKIQAEVVGISKGPVITMFEILPSPGVKLSKIVNLADNIALRLAASSVRIVAPIPGKHAVGIEIPNRHRAIVSFAEMINSEKFSSAKMEIPVALGKDIGGEPQIVDLVNTPHLLIAGATGSGKSVCVNSIICSILYRRSPEEVKLLLIDPKIVELKFYNDIPHLLTPVVTEPKRAFQALQYAIYEMERRYSLLDSLGVRNIRSYNRKIRTKNIATTPMPYLVIVVDEFADLMATTGKELETTLARLAAMSRAVGIHLVLATQRPSIDVITGLIKANIPSRIAFMVAGKFDSRIIIDAVGAEKLLGRGDMLFTSSWDPFPIRMQGAFIGEEELERVVDYVKTLGPPDYIDDEIFIDEDEENFFEEDEEDPLMNKAVEIVTVAGRASASYLQRRLKIGYNRAARMIETMERRGIVGPADGSKPRQVFSVPE